MRGQRERESLRRWNAIYAKYAIALDQQEAFTTDMYELLCPEPAASLSHSEVTTMWAKIGEYLEGLDEGATVPTVDDLVGIAGLEPSRSASIHVRKFLKGSNLLQHHPATTERYTRRLTDSSGNGSGH
jgi:hypothetical protein